MSLGTLGSLLLVLRLVDVTWSPMGAMRASKVMSKLEELVGDQLIEDLPIPVTTVATDLVRQRHVMGDDHQTSTRCLGQ